MNTIIPECFYRISIKALILNETRDKFLLVQESQLARSGLASCSLVS